MYIQKFFLICFSITCFAADQGMTKPIDNYVGTLGGLTAVLWCGLYEWKVQHDMQHATSHKIVVDAQGRRGVEYAYTPDQRLVAQTRSQGVGAGFVSTAALLLHSGMPYNIIKEITPQSLLTQFFSTTVVYNATKEFLDSTYINSSAAMKVGIAGTAACVLPKLFFTCGMSPERMVMHAMLTHLITHRANLYRHWPVLGKFTNSCARASHVMPLVQMMVSRYSIKPTVFTAHAVRRSSSLVNPADYVNGIVPGLVYVGVDLSFNAFAESSVGHMVETQYVDPIVDTVVNPLPEQVRKPIKSATKKILFEGAKIGATGTFLVGLTATGAL